MVYTVLKHSHVLVWKVIFEIMENEFFQGHITSYLFSLHDYFLGKRALQLNDFPLPRKRGSHFRVRGSNHMCETQMKASKQYFRLILFILLYKVVLTFVLVD